MRPIFIAAMLAVASTPAAAQTYISGTAHAGDGDSLTVSGLSVRLFGIDAPELGQDCTRGGIAWKCGEEAKRRLQSMVDGQTVSCRRVDTDEFGRTVAVCTANRQEINKAMVETGWATAFRRYSDAYVAVEERAKFDRVGVWGSEFAQPADYRHQHEPRLRSIERQPRQMLIQPGAPSSGCLIKGNHSRKGEFIYHLPGMPYYEQTRAEEMFCSEAEAQAAGYRRSRAHN